MLDLLIYKLAFISLILSAIRWQALPAAFLLCASLAYSQYIFNPNLSWSEAAEWTRLNSIKDAIIITLIPLIFIVVTLFLAPKGLAGINWSKLRRYGSRS